MKSCLDFCRASIHRVYITEAAQADPEGREAAERAETVWPGRVQEIASRAHVPEIHRDRSTLVVDTLRGRAVGRCPGSRGHLCCNYQTINLYAGCNLGCSYCIMETYLNYSPIVVQTGTRQIVAAIEEAAARTPERELRVGSGEVGDSLLFDPVFRLNEKIILGLSGLANVRYEMKSKTACVDHLLHLPEKDRAVLGFSLNPPSVVSSEEGHAASVAERLAAARRSAAAGYQVAFHFDPIILSPAFPAEYEAVLSSLSEFVDIAWISLGTMRFPPSSKDSVRSRSYAAAEFVQARDGKLRYLQPVRRRAYRTMVSMLRRITPAPIYLCMESEVMWRGVFGATPDQLPELRGIFDAETMNREQEKPGRNP